MSEQLQFPFQSTSKFNIGDKVSRRNTIGTIRDKMRKPQNTILWVYYFVYEGTEVNDTIRIWCEENELKKIT